MAFEPLVRNLLLEAPPVIADGKVYPLVRPQGVPLPAITYQRISTTRVDPLGEPNFLADGRLQIDCWAASYGAVKDLADAVRRRLNGFAEAKGPRPRLAGIRALPSHLDDYETDTEVYRVSQDFSVWFEED
jgi:Protein of unknown function (DUF3168)